MNKEKQQKKIVDDLKLSDVQKQREVIIYSVSAIVITLVLGTISITNLGAYFPGITRACQILAFVACGMVHVYYLNKNTSFPAIRFPANNKLFFSLSLFLLISIVLILLYLFTDRNMLVMSFTSGCSFLLPFVIQQAWETYNNFPQKRYKLWYNSDVVMDSRTTVFLNSLPIRLQLSMKYFDITEEVFEVTVPGHTQFGKFFNQFIIEKNKNNASSIECVDLEKRPFGWQFYTERFKGWNRQYIDPELSLRENNVKDHSIITAKRQRTNESPKEILPVAESKPLPQLNRTTTKIKKHEAGK